jgi:hypothetical protein
MGVETIKDLVGAGAPPDQIYQAVCQQERYDSVEVLAILGIKHVDVNPPTNTTVPYAAQDNAEVTCTMGEWLGEPTSYAYQWQADGVDVGTGTPYVVTAADEGKVFTCVVSATNANGTGVAPASNAVTVTAPVSRSASKTEHKTEAEHKNEQHGRMPARHDEPKGKSKNDS